MRHTACITIVLLLAASCVVALTATDRDLDEAFEQFKIRFERRYASPEEEARRKSIFASTWQSILQMRAANPYAAFGVNKFADKTYVEAHGGHRLMSEPPRARRDIEAPPALKSRALPSAVDWRKKGAVSPVVNEGDCGSIICGLGVAGNVEGAVKIASGKPLVPLSAQEGMVCGNITCGCYLRATYEMFLTKMGGNIDTAASWPLNVSQCEQAGYCDTKDRVVGGHFSKMIQIAHTEDAMTAETALSPITVAVYSIPWETYISGVLTNCGYGQPDHVAVIVGYNDDTHPAYWILKNSWGTDWGMDGFIYVAKGTNQCNVTYEPLTVRV